jgi:RNase H-fold protein (predicted Holliday junction resolvase)
MMNKRNGGTLGIDWGKKHIGLAFVGDQTDVIFPLGTMTQDDMVLYALANIVAQRGVQHIVVGYPSEEGFVQRSIDRFVSALQCVVSPDVVIVRVNEDYSSVEANAIVGVYRKIPAEDSLAAGVLLERWMHGA